MTENQTIKQEATRVTEEVFEAHNAILQSLKETLKNALCMDMVCPNKASNVLLMSIKQKHFCLFICDDCLQIINESSNPSNEAEFMILTRDQLEKGDSSGRPDQDIEPDREEG